MDPGESLKNQHLLDHVSLRQNQWECTCANQVLQQWLQYSEKVINSTSVICSSPEDYIDRQLIEFNDTCSAKPEIKWFKDPKMLAITVGVSVFALLITVSAFMAFRFRTEIQVVLYAKYGLRFGKPLDFWFCTTGVIEFY